MSHPINFDDYKPEEKLKNPSQQILEKIKRVFGTAPVAEIREMQTNLASIELDVLLRIFPKDKFFGEMKSIIKSGVPISGKQAKCIHIEYEFMKSQSRRILNDPKKTITMKDYNQVFVNGKKKETATT